MVVCKFFTPDSNWTWYAFTASGGADNEQEPKDVQFFGLVEGHETEFGYFWLSELENVRGPMGLHIERDLHWIPITVSELKRQKGI
jgi:hypothetical protein